MFSVFPSSTTADSLNGCAVVYDKKVKVPSYLHSQSIFTPSTSCPLSSQATPTITTTSFSGSALVTGSVLTVTGTKFLATMAGVGAGPGGSTLSAAQLNTITLVGHSGLALTSNATIDCPVTTATATQLQCVIPPLVAGGYTVRVVVGLGRGLAVNHAASGRRLSANDDDSANSFAPPPLCCFAPSTPSSTVFKPTSGSRAGGMRLTLTGTGDTTILGIFHVVTCHYSCDIPTFYLPNSHEHDSGFSNMLSNANITTNNVTIGNRPCVVITASPVSMTCITPPSADTTTTTAALAAGLAVADPVWVNGKVMLSPPSFTHPLSHSDSHFSTLSLSQELPVSYSYGAAVTPVLDWLFPTSVPTSVTTFVHLTLANVQVILL